LDLQVLVNGIEGFNEWNHAKKIRFFAWYIHAQQGRDRFNAGDIKSCYDLLHLEKPSNISPFLSEMEKRKPKEALKDGRGYYLVKTVRDSYETMHGQRDITIQVTKLLSDLPAHIPKLEERSFLAEGLICFRHGAFRAAIVMCWNLAYDHLCNYVLKNHLSTFNTRWPIRFPKQHQNCRISVVGKRDDFMELKESEVIDICRSAAIITNDVYKILDEKLGRRNSAAHPNDIKITQVQAEDFITDLINNVVLKLA
jgi:hypothetical protein